MGARSSTPIAAPNTLPALASLVLTVAYLVLQPVHGAAQGAGGTVARTRTAARAPVLPPQAVAVAEPVAAKAPVTVTGPVTREETPPVPEEMVASWYGEEFAGLVTANGEVFDPQAMTAAHKELPFGTRLQVTNPATGRSVEVRINDRGPFITGRDLDLSAAAFARIAPPAAGVLRVQVRRLGAR